MQRAGIDGMRGQVRILSPRIPRAFNSNPNPRHSATQPKSPDLAASRFPYSKARHSATLETPPERHPVLGAQRPPNGRNIPFYLPFGSPDARYPVPHRAIEAPSPRPEEKSDWHRQVKIPHEWEPEASYPAGGSFLHFGRRTPAARLGSWRSSSERTCSAAVRCQAIEAGNPPSIPFRLGRAARVQQEPTIQPSLASGSAPSTPSTCKENS